MNKMLKKMCAFICACLIACGLPTTAFAAEVTEAPELTEQVNSEAVMVLQPGEEAVPYANAVVTGSVAAWSDNTFTVHLNSYIGFVKTFRVTSQSPNTTQGGGLDIIVKKGDKLVSDGNWWMGVNDVGDWDKTLPSSGDYTVQIVNRSPDVVYVTMQWL